MFLFELEAADIDRELETVAGNIQNAGSAGQPTAGGGLGPEMGDMGAPGQTPGEFPQNQPQIPGVGAEGPTPEDDDLYKKKVDAYLLSAVKGMEYVTDFKHRESSNIHPFRLAQMEVDELSKAVRMVKNKLDITGMNVETGKYDNPQMTFFGHMLAYLERVLDLKKRAGAEGRSKKIGRTAKPEARKQSKNEKKK